MTLTSAQADLAADLVSLARGQAWGFFRRSTGCDLDDCMSAAMFGLCQALESWDSYCERNDFDPSRKDYRKAYLLRRINGSLLDMARANDHMTRSDRHKAKALRQAEDDGARGDDELAAATGLSVRETRRVQADALMHFSLDGYELEVGDTGASLADAGPGVEAQVTLREMLAGFLAAFDGLDAETRVVLAMRYHGEVDFKVIAERLRTSPERVVRLHDEGVLAVHRALILQAQDEGTGPRRPARIELAVHVRAADSCQSAEGAAVAAGKRCNGCGRVLKPEDFSWRNKAKGWRMPLCPPCDGHRNKRWKAARASVTIS